MAWRKGNAVMIIISLILSIIIFSSTSVPSVINQKEENPVTSIESTHPIGSTINSNMDPFKILSEPIDGLNTNILSSGSPKIAVEGDKKYVVWSDFNNTNGCGDDGETFFRYFNGLSWSEIQVISEPMPGMDISNGSGEPDIAIEDGKIYVVWSGDTNFNGEGKDGDIYFRCNITGSNWEPIQVISEPVIGENYNIALSWHPRLAVDNGNIYVTWVDDNDTNDASSNEEDIFFRCNLTRNSWENIQVISEPELGKDLNDGFSYFPDIAADNGSIYVTWCDNFIFDGSSYDYDIFYRCNLSGQGWDQMQVVSEPQFGKNKNQGLSWDPKIAAENGKVYIIWHDDNDSENSKDDMDIHFRCNLIGSSWQNIEVISEPVYRKDFNKGDSYEKEITVENGNVYVVWEDINQTFNCGGDKDIHYRSKKSGYDWGLIQVISEPILGLNTNSENSDFPSIAVDSSKVHVVWRDKNDTKSSGTDWDIFYKEILPITLVDPNVNPGVGSTSTFFNFSVSYCNNQNLAPTEIYLITGGETYAMQEQNTNDMNYLNGKKYYCNVTHLAIGVHNVRFKAVCGVNVTYLPLLEPITVFNTPPKLTLPSNGMAIEDNYFELTDIYLDIDVKNVGQPLLWNFSTNADWLTFNSTNAILEGTPTNYDVGDFWVDITVNDTFASDWMNETITVSGVNDRPVINTPNIEFTYEDELYRVDYNATDIDSPKNDQEWTLSTNTSTWLTINSKTGVLKGIPTNDDTGKYWVNTTVDDADGGLDWSNFTLTVININDPPNIITDDHVTAVTDEYYEIDYEAIDIDSILSKQSWSLVTNASGWLSIDRITGMISGTPSNDDLGWYNVNISVTDGDGGVDWHEFILRVIRPNAPPKILTNDNITAIIIDQYQTSYEAEDDRTPINNLVWTFKTNASWLNYYPASVTIYGTPTISDIGTYWVNISVEDGDFAVSYHNFTLTVTKNYKPIVPLNDPPVLSEPKMDPESGDTDTAFEFSVHYYDPDSEPPTSIQVVIDDIVHDLYLVPSQMSANGTYKIKLKLSEGTHGYYFTASDGNEQINLEEISTSYIKKVDDKPSLIDQYILIWIVIFVIIIGFLFIFGVIRSKASKKRQAKEETKSYPGSQPSSTVQSSGASSPILRSVGVSETAKEPSKPVITPAIKVKPKPTLSLPTGIKLVGRDEVLGKLMGYLTNASAGLGKALFISGEAGIGKTRLVTELKQLAQAKSYYVLSGNCISESLTPFLPFREALTSGGLTHLFVKQVPRVEAVYLLTNDGLLVKEVIRKETKLNPDLFAAMLTTVSNFLKESLSSLLGTNKEGKLNTLGYENYRILIESSTNTNLVTIISGKENEFLIEDISKVFENLNKHYGYILSQWDGSEECIKGIEQLIQPLITSGKYDGVSYEALDPRARRDMLFENITLGLIRQAQTIPTMFIIEDLQWADTSSLALLYYVAKKIRNSRFLIIGTYRPEDVIGEGKSHPLNEILKRMDREELCEELRLQRLPEDCIPEFLIYLLGPTEFSDDFRHRIYQETDGNPLFIIQLIKFMVEEKNLVCDEGTWRLEKDKDLDKIDIPSKIYNVIARRLDRLDKEYRKVLDYASVIGDTFTSALLLEATKMDKIQLLEYLRDLEKSHRLIHSLDGKFKFDHEKIKAVVYNELPAELKIEYHMIVGNTIEMQNKNNLDEVSGELAFHYYHANNREKVLYYLRFASDKAKRNYANSEAIELYKKALELETEPGRRIEIYESMGDIYYLIRNYDMSFNSYSEALKLAKGNKSAELLAKLGGILERKSEYDKSFEFCKKALDLVLGSGSNEEALALQNLGNVMLFKKMYSEALMYYEKSLTIRENLRDIQGIGACHNNIGLVHYGKKEYALAVKHLEKSLVLRKQLGDLEGTAATLSNLGAVYQMTGEKEKANDHLKDSRDIRTQIGEPFEVTPEYPDSNENSLDLTN